MTDDHPIIAALPEEARSTFARLMERAVRSPDAMREQIPHSVTAIERAAATGRGRRRGLLRAREDHHGGSRS